MTGQVRSLGRRVAAPLVIVATATAVAGLWSATDVDALAAGTRAAREDPAGLVLALGGFASAFLLRAAAWQRTLPGLSLGHALAGIHLSLGGNHVLPLRLGEPLRMLSVVRRAGVDPAAAVASTVALRSADLLTLLALGALAAPGLVAGRLGPAGGVAVVLLAMLAAAAWWHLGGRGAAAAGRRPDVLAVLATAAAWMAEAVLVHVVVGWFGVSLSPAESVVVLAAAVGSQLVAIAPGGLGTYEAAAAAALTTLGAEPTVAVAAALATHAVKTAYSLLVGAVALWLPAPALWGRLRLPATSAWRAPAPAGEGPVVLFLPAHDEGPRVGAVVDRVPARVRGRPVQVVVVDDGSTDRTGVAAREAGAEVVRHPANLGLGAAVRTGLAEATKRGAAAVAFCDADGEYDPAELERLVAPVLDGAAEYVAGSRFDGTIRRMRPHRRVGNLALTAWVRWTVRQPVTDGQSGYRAFSAAAAADAHIPHDYNYAQVLTIDLLAKGYRYAEVPITYAFRTSGRSFVSLGRYLRRVLPAVWRQLNPTHVPSTAKAL